MTDRKLLFFITEDYYVVSHRLSLAVAARQAGYDVAVITRVREHGETIRAAGLRLIPFDNERSRLNPFKEFWTLVRLVRIYRREKPDLVHHVAMKPVLYGSLASRLSGRPATVNALAGMGWLFTSGDGLAQRLKPLVRWALTRALRRGVVVVQNPDDAGLVAQLGVSPSRIRQIAGSGVNLNEFRPTPVKNQLPVVLLPARMLWDKGIGEFVEAARLLRQRGATARFVLAGDPDSLNPASIPAREIAGWVREGIVEHLGWVSNMPELLATADIVCLPSYREGLPRSLMEAAAAGRAIVTTDVPGCRTLVHHGHNGLLVPPRDAVSLAEAIWRLLDDRELRDRMGAHGRTMAENVLADDVVIPQVLSLYLEMAR